MKMWTFEVPLQVYQGKAAWHYVLLPGDVAEAIEFRYGHLKRGWGSLPVRLTIGDSTISTSIFTDKKRGTFMLPMKASLRKSKELTVGMMVEITLEVAIDSGW